jgi:phosphoribosylanthranilate isomerase
MKTWIKICATTCIEDALASIDAGANALGFVFAPSKRRVFPEQARTIVAQLPEGIERVGVFNDEMVECVAEIVQQVGLTAVQLHGSETLESIHSLLSKLNSGPPIRVIKSVLVNGNFAAQFSRVCRDYDCVDSILLDSGGGSGKTFDWQSVESLLGDNKKPLIIAGGLNPENVGEAIRRFSPYGVDVVTGVEREPGRKDPDKLKAFVAAVRRVEQS